jgi:hypothetical protein
MDGKKNNGADMIVGTPCIVCVRKRVYTSSGTFGISALERDTVQKGNIATGKDVAFFDVWACRQYGGEVNGMS